MGTSLSKRGMCNAVVERKDTHTSELSATTNSLGSKSHFRLYLQVIKLTDEQHLTQLAGQFPAMLLGYHRKETSKKIGEL